jgi:hypothetical protein
MCIRDSGARTREIAAQHVGEDLVAHHRAVPRSDPQCLHRRPEPERQGLARLGDDWQADHGGAVMDVRMPVVRHKVRAHSGCTQRIDPLPDVFAQLGGVAWQQGIVDVEQQR